MANEYLTSKETKEQYGEKCKEKLIGKTIKDCRYLTDKEVSSFGWCKSALAIFFTDGTVMYASTDDEGNDAGALQTNIKGLEIIPTI
jgi:hypothetical protein